MSENPAFLISASVSSNTPDDAIFIFAQLPDESTEDIAYLDDKTVDLEIVADDLALVLLIADDSTFSM
jgi:hypothetical protein